jgi:tetratricopeptide (TPR) repeat protein
MNDQDKAFARKALEKKLLTIEQIESIRDEVELSGRSFEQVAAAYGLKKETVAAPAPPSKVKIPLLYEILIVLTLLIVIGVPVSIWRLIQTSKKDVELALESEKSSVDADRKAGEARAGYQRELIMNRDARAGEALGRARAAMARVTPSSDPKSPDIAQALNEAFVGYNMYLDVNPDDAAVRVERAKTHELRRNYDLAIADLERVIQLQPASAKMFQDKIAQLRLFLARTPK